MSKKKRRRFKSEQSAISFADKVNGKVNDLRDVKEAKSPFTVTYEPTEQTKEYNTMMIVSNEYPEEYWR